MKQKRFDDKDVEYVNVDVFKKNDPIYKKYMKKIKEEEGEEAMPNPAPKKIEVEEEDEEEYDSEDPRDIIKAARRTAVKRNVRRILGK